MRQRFCVRACFRAVLYKFVTTTTSLAHAMNHKRTNINKIKIFGENNFLTFVPSSFITQHTSSPNSTLCYATEGVTKRGREMTVMEMTMLYCIISRLTWG